MIPFLKKNKDGRKPPKSTVPRTAQESIPFQRMFEDGTCRVRPGYYTRTIQYQDINYQLAQQEDKTAIMPRVAPELPAVSRRTKNSGTPTTAAAPKQISCRAVRLKATLDFTLLKSRGTEI